VKLLLSIYSVTAFLFCVGLMLLPGFWINLYGAHVDPQAVVLMRLAGSLFGGIGLISWLARNAERETRRAIVLGLIVSNSLAAAAALSGAISGVYNQFAWGPVMTFGFFAIAFVQSIFKKSGRAPIHGARGV